MDPRTANSLISSSAERSFVDRRSFVAATLSVLVSSLLGCGGRPGATSNQPAQPKLEPLAIPSLDVVVPLAGLRWLVVARPREIAEISWLAPSVSLLLDKERLDRSAISTGFDLRKLSEAIWAAYRTNVDAEDASFQLVRHTNDSLEIERLFRDRLSTDIVRSIDDPHVLRVSGRIGKTLHAFSAMGKDIVCLQQDGSADRGPCRVASLLALRKLKRTRAVFDDAAMFSLAKRFSSAPFQMYAPGPFEGDLAHGIRGLLAASTAIGASFRPTPRESLSLEIVLTGDFSTTGFEASRKLAASWDDLASRPLGHLLGLDKPIVAVVPGYVSEMVWFVVELDARKLAKGLADATSSQIREIMQ